MKSSRLLSIALMVCLSSSIVFAGCGAEKEVASVATGTVQASATTQAKETKKNVTISYMLGDPTDTKFFTEKLGEFTKKYPNLKVDIQGFSEVDTLQKNLKIRQAGGEFPDVVQLKPNFINDFKDSLATWDSEDVAKNNKYTTKFAVDGKAYGVPLRATSEYVYYKKSIFSELNLQIPTTWDKFIELAQTIKKNGKYVPIAMGGKDAWPDYPFNEFMPHLISNDTAILTNIAKQDEPFSKGGGFYDSYSMIDKLYKADVFGSKPLGIGADEAKSMFESNKAAMICLGTWYLPQYLDKVKNTDDLGVFPLPIVNNASESNRVITMVDNFLCVSKDSKNLNEAKAFVDWSLSKEIYPDYLKTTYASSTVNGITSDVPLFKEYNDKFKYDELIYYPGDQNYTKLSNETKFDVKAIGQRMMAGNNFEDILNDMNKKWKAARARLSIK